MHIAGLEKLGARVEIEHGYVVARAPRLTGTQLWLDFPSVGATENLLMAAVLAKGTSTIDNAAREPEIVDLCQMLVQMGAAIDGIGSTTLVIDGVEGLHPTEHVTVPDRIVAGTWAIGAGMTRGDVTVVGARAEHLEVPLEKLTLAGAEVDVLPDGFRVQMAGRPSSVDLVTLPYPGFPTDLQPMFLALDAVAEGTAMVTENVFEARWMYLDELRRLGADVRTDGHHAVVRGRPTLSAAPVLAHDIRAGAGLVLAALVADGTTEISDVHHIDRGYPRFVEQLVALGADVRRETVPELGCPRAGRACGRARRRPGRPAPTAGRPRPRRRCSARPRRAAGRAGPAPRRPWARRPPAPAGRSRPAREPPPAGARCGRRGGWWRTPSGRSAGSRRARGTPRAGRSCSGSSARSRLRLLGDDVASSVSAAGRSRRPGAAATARLHPFAPRIWHDRATGRRLPASSSTRPSSQDDDGPGGDAMSESVSVSVIALPAARAGGFTLQELERGRLLRLTGRLDVTVAADVRLALARAVTEGAERGLPDLVLDLSDLQQVDATGLGVLVGAHRAAGRAGRSLVLLDVPPQVERLLLVTRLHRVLRSARSSRTA
jgi:anti-anti-sigma factor